MPKSNQKFLKKGIVVFVLKPLKSLLLMIA